MIKKKTGQVLNPNRPRKIRNRPYEYQRMGTVKHRAGANPISIYDAPLPDSEFSQVSRGLQQEMFADPIHFSKYWHLFVTAINTVLEQDSGAGKFLVRHIELLEAEIKNLKES